MTIEVSELIYPKGTKILLASVPIGNMPLIKAKEYLLEVKGDFVDAIGVDGPSVLVQGVREVGNIKVTAIAEGEDTDE